jgi:hypothetical protein
VLLHFLCPACACPHAGGHALAARYFAARAAARLALEGHHAPEARTWGELTAWEVLEAEVEEGGGGGAGARAPGAAQLAAACLLGLAAARALAGAGGLNDAGAFSL